MFKTRLILTALSIVSTSTFAAQTVNVYTEEFFGADWGPSGEIKTLFEKMHPQCEVKYTVFDQSSTLLNRLRLEKSNTQADIVLGLHDQQLESAEKTGLFEKFDFDLKQLDLPENWKNPLFIPYEFGQFAFIYDKTKLTTPPKSLQELVERQDLRVIYQDPRTSSMGRGLVTWMNAVFNDKQIEQAWKNLAKHTVTVGKGWTETYGAFLKGEADLVFSHNTSPIYHLLQEQKDQYAATQFTEGAVYQYTTAAKIAGKNNACADNFLQFIFTPEAQRIITPKNVMLSTISAQIEPHFDALKASQKSVKTLDTSHATDENLKNWISIWQSVLSK